MKKQQPYLATLKGAFANKKKNIRERGISLEQKQERKQWKVCKKKAEQENNNEEPKIQV